MASIGGYDRDDVKVKGVDSGGVDQEIRATDGDGKWRLCVDTGDTGDDLASTRRVVYAEKYLENGGSDDMTVDGSTTSVDFVVGPPSGQIWVVTNLGITIRDNGANDDSKFGAILGGLTNGLLVSQDIDGTEYDVMAYKNNLDLANGFTTASHFVGVGTGFINDANLFTGNMNFSPGVKLIGADGDQIIGRVRDDLTGLNNLVMRITYWRDVQ